MDMARKCSLPKRVPIPGTNVLPEDAYPPEMSLQQSNMFGFRCFLYDFGLASLNQNLSRSYLPDLEALVNQVGFESDLVKACRAVSFGSHGKRLNRPTFVSKAEVCHHEVLTSLRKKILRSSTTRAAELKRVVMLLGLYQVRFGTQAIMVVRVFSLFHR
jgi:hypothetical protein